MPKAGFYAIHNSEIRFGRDGEWYADGERIENDRIAALFARSVRRSAGGGYELVVGDERAPIIVDDTPYVVTGASAVGEGLQLELNDGSVETLDTSSLRVGAAEVLYCDIKNGTGRARFTRPAYYQIAAFIRATEKGRFALEVAGRVYPIADA